MHRPRYPFVYTTTGLSSSPATGGVTLTTPAGAYGDSAWVVVNAATVEEWVVVGVSASPDSTGLGETEIDIGVGAAGSELVVATVPHYAGPAAMLPLLIPARIIPVGSRVTLRLRSQTAAAGHLFDCALWYYAGMPIGRVITCPDTITIEPNVAGGVGAGLALASTGVAWQSSAWVQVIAETGTLWMVQALHLSAVTGTTPMSLEIDLGTGAVGSEAVVTTVRWCARTATAARPTQTAQVWPPLRIPVGVRISARIRSSNASVDTVNLKVVYTGNDHGLDTILTDLPVAWYPPAATSVAVTKAVGAWANSPWGQLVASTAAAGVLTGLAVNLNNNSGECEFDVGQGAAGFETVIATFRTAIDTAGTASDHVVLRLAQLQTVAAGVRLAVRARAAGAPAVSFGAALGYIASRHPLQQADNPQLTYPAAANGVSLAPVGAAWTNSPWGVLATGAASDIILTGIALTNNGANQEVIVELGIGAAASETVLTQLRCWTHSVMNLWFPLPMPHLVAAATRLSVRFRHSGASATRLVSVTYVPTPEELDPVTIPAPTQQWRLHRCDSDSRKEGPS